MIGKIVTGKSFGGAVEYVLRKEKARLLDSDGVDTGSIRSIIDDFNFQRKTRPEIAKVVGHISLSFHRNDAPKLTDDLMRELAMAYMGRMGIADTQYIVARHNDTEHPHLHILYNRVRYDQKLVPDRNERRRNAAICKQIKQAYGLTFSKGRENVKTERLHAPDKTRQQIHNAVARILPKCPRMDDLIENLCKFGIETRLIHRSNDPRKDVQGITFTKSGLTFKGSKIDRKFSYANLQKKIEKNSVQQKSQSVEAGSLPFTPEQWNQLQENRALQLVVRVNDANVLRHYWYDKKGELQYTMIALRRRGEPFTRELVTAIKGHRLTVQEQTQLYSEQGLTLSFRKENGEVYQSRFGVKLGQGQKDVLTECIGSVQNPQETNSQVIAMALKKRGRGI